jgi:hypothetical protein
MAVLPAAGSGTTTVGRYLTDAASLIASRVSDLADTAARHRPLWMQALGQPPADPNQQRNPALASS